MAKQFFEVEKGLLFEGITILPVSGAPNGGDYDTAGVGSVAMDTTLGHLYHKILSGSGANKWERLATATDIANISIQTDWRESVSVADLVSTTLPTGTATETITVNTIVIDDGQRVLFGTLTAHPNVYIYNKATGLFVEDINEETPGDTVYVEQGTSGGRTLTYNYSGQWVLTNQSSLDEEGYIRAFIGKTAAGNSMPAYQYNRYIVDGDSIVTAIDKIDNKVYAIENPALTGTYFVNTDTIQTITTKLDTALTNVRKETTVTNITTATTIDTVLVDNWDVVKWLVKVKANADNTIKQYVEISAVHNGNATNDATGTPDFNVFSKLRIGVIDGLSYNVVLSDATTAQTMGLSITSTDAVDVTAIRTVL
jgi:hypothetical protein